MNRLDQTLGLAHESFQRYSSSSGEEVEEKKYGPEVPVAKDVETGEIVKIPHTGKTRVLTVAKSGEGKTILGKAYLSRIVDKRGSVFAGTDIKNDFQTFNYRDGPSKSLQEYTEGLLPGEKKKINRLQKEGEFKNHFDRTLAIPYFLKDVYETSPRNYAKLFSIGFDEVEEHDLKYLFGFDSWSDAQQDIFEDVLLDAGTDNLSWNFLEKSLNDKGRSGEKVWTKIRKFKEKNIISSKGESLESVLSYDDVTLVSLGLKGIDSRQISDRYLKFYSALLHRKIIEKVRNSIVDLPFVVFDDEVHEMAPASDDSPVTDELQLVFSRKGRQAGIATWLSTQKPHKIPSEHDKSPHELISATSHAFIGRGISWKGYRTVFQAFSFYNSNNTQSLRDLTNSLDEGEFLYCDESMDSVYDVKKVRPLSPLVAHPEN